MKPIADLKINLNNSGTFRIEKPSAGIDVTLTHLETAIWIAMTRHDWSFVPTSETLAEVWEVPAIDVQERVFIMMNMLIKRGVLAI